MLLADKKRFALILDNILHYHPDTLVIVDQKRDSKTIYVDSRKVSKTSDLINKGNPKGGMDYSGMGLIRSVKKSFDTFIAGHFDYLVLSAETGLYDFPHVPRLNGPVYTNRLLYSELPKTTEFYIIDLRHAYWRIAYLKGLISENLYMSQIAKKESKLFRNMALACTMAARKRSYYLNGEMVYEVTESCKPYETLYTNIRHICYNAVGDCHRALPEQVFAYRVDAVYVLPEGLEKAKKILQNKGLRIKTIACHKVNDEYYADENGELKKI